MSAVTTDDFHFFAAYLKERSAITIGPGKEYLVESRLGPLARDTGYADVGALIGELRRPVPNATVRDRVVEAMTTNETSFFRDAHPFDALRNHVLPELLEARKSTRRLSVWSAAASTGQEIYTIAMVLDGTPGLQGWDVRLHGTDLSEKVLDKARSGRFSALEINRGLPAPMMVKYFERSGAEYVIDERLRKQCTFAQMNLAGTWGLLPTFDIVYCRNVLIYFDVPTRTEILTKIRARLAPGGFLFLGAAESTLGVVDGYEQVRLGNTVAYRLGGSR